MWIYRALFSISISLYNWTPDIQCYLCLQKKCLPLSVMATKHAPIYYYLSAQHNCRWRNPKSDFYDLYSKISNSFLQNLVPLRFMYQHFLGLVMSSWRTLHPHWRKFHSKSGMIWKRIVLRPHSSLHFMGQENCTFHPETNGFFCALFILIYTFIIIFLCLLWACGVPNPLQEYQNLVIFLSCLPIRGL